MQVELETNEGIKNEQKEKQKGGKEGKYKKDGVSESNEETLGKMNQKKKKIKDKKKARNENRLKFVNYQKITCVK